MKQALIKMHSTKQQLQLILIDVNKETLLDKTSYGNKGSCKYNIGILDIDTKMKPFYHQ